MAEPLTEDFTREEFECKCGCGANTIRLALVNKLQEIRNLIQLPVKINCGVRCERHNRTVGGEPDSAHLKGMAADVRCPDSKFRLLFIKAALMCGITRIGCYETFIHVDIDPDKPQDVMWYI